MKRSLPKYMYQDGSSYRTKLPDGRRINLGTNKEVAIHRLNVLLSQPDQIDMSNPKVVEAIWKRHKKGASQRGLEFTLTTEYITNVLAQQGNRCAVTYLPFRDDKPEGMRVRPWAPSIDRIGGSVGYIPGNIRIVCCFVNVAMNGFGDDFFALVIEPLVEARIKARLACSN